MNDEDYVMRENSTPMSINIEKIDDNIKSYIETNYLYIYDEFGKVLDEDYSLVSISWIISLLTSSWRMNLQMPLIDVILSAMGLDVSKDNVVYKEGFVNLKEGDIHTSHIYNPELYAIIVIPESVKDKKIYFSSFLEFNKTFYEADIKKKRINKKYFSKYKKKYNNNWTQYINLVNYKRLGYLSAHICVHEVFFIWS